MRGPFCNLSLRSLRRPLGGVCVLCLGVATLGIPLPTLPVKFTGEPFPCMNCGCGCLNAEMCWRECCCYSTAEKLAWARENGVTPPAFLVALAEQESHEHDAKHDSDCCAADQPDAGELAHLKPCCRARILAQRAASQSCHKSCSSCGQPKRRSSDRPVAGVLVFQALKCQGLSLSVSLLPPCVPSAAELSLESLSPAPGRIALIDQFYAGATDLPDVPPPRGRV